VVEGEAVDLDDEALLGPVQIDLVGADPDVRVRPREARFLDQLEQAAFGFGAGEAWLVEGCRAGS
jgi:hypothetical protein